MSVEDSLSLAVFTHPCLLVCDSPALVVSERCLEENLLSGCDAEIVATISAWHRTRASCKEDVLSRLQRHLRYDGSIFIRRGRDTVSNSLGVRLGSLVCFIQTRPIRFNPELLPMIPFVRFAGQFSHKNITTKWIQYVEGQEWQRFPIDICGSRKSFVQSKRVRTSVSVASSSKQPSTQKGRGWRVIYPRFAKLRALCF
jgi:hypothetical protein